MSRIFILYLLSLTLRSLVLAGLVAIAMTASKKVQVRHAVWTLVLCALFLMPIADVLLPAKLVPSSVPRLAAPIQTLAIHVSAPEVHSAQPREGTTPEPRRDWWQVALMVAVGVTVAMTMRLILVLATVARLRRKSKAVSGPACDGLNGARLLESDAITVPLTIGFVKPSVILPLAWRSWDEWKLRAVLLHEYTHVRRRDPAIAAVAALAKSIFWFNPLAWSLERKLSTLAEQASDEACVQVCGNPRRYAETLLEFASVARDGHRWIGGVAMARHKISLRIERILSLRNPGEGVLQRAGWLALSAALLPALYFSAAAQSQQAVTVASSKIEFAPTLRQELAAVPEPGIVLQLAPRPAPAAPASTPGQATPTPPATPNTPPPQPAPVQPVNPDLVGEIRLILAPVDSVNGQQGGVRTIEYTTQDGTRRWSGNAVWPVRNGLLGTNAFMFSITGVQNRSVLLEDGAGNSFSYGCPDCAFEVWEKGVGKVAATTDPALAIQLSADGKTLSATCQAKECRVGSARTNPAAPTGGPFDDLWVIFPSGSTQKIGIARSVSGKKTCFSLYGDVKADGTSFTDADCTDDGPASPLSFSIAR